MVGLTELDQLDYGVAMKNGATSTTQATGLAGLATPEALNIAQANRNTLQRMQDFGSLKFDAPPPTAAPNKPVLAISRSTGKIWANGKLFTLDDAQGAVESEQFLNQPPAPAPAAEATDWEALDPDAYAQHLASIRNPGTLTLASKNFGIGVDNMQMLGGYGLQFLGATETGQAVVQSQLEDLNKNAPYQRNFEDIGSSPERGVMDWFVANLAQQGPNLVESAVTAVLGAAVGGAAGGGPNPATAVGGAISAMVGKQAFKQSLLAAAKKYMAGEALDAAESKLLKEAAGLTLAARKELFEKVGSAAVDKAGTATLFTADDAVKSVLSTGAQKAATGGLSQARMGGAAIATGTQNYMAGVSDLYGDSVEGGSPDRGYAALGGIPYAALESLPEFVAALRIFKGVGAGIGARSMEGMSRWGKAGELGLRAGRGFAAGAALEGTTELGQETLGIGANDSVDMDSPEALSRMLNAFAAGAAIGGFVGAGSNMNTGKAHDLLSGGAKPAEQNGPTILSGEIIPPTQPGGSTVGPDGSVPRLGAPTAGALPPPTAPDMGMAAEAPTTPMSPTPEQTQPDMLAGPVPQLAAPPAPAQAAPAAAAPPVIPMGGPTAGSALQQAGEGTLTGGVPGAMPNRLQQLQQQARQQQLEATSGSALAQIGRGELQAPLTEPGGRATMGEQATGQMVEPLTGKAKLKRGKKVMQVEGMPQAAPVAQEVPNAVEERQQSKGDKLQRKGTGGRLEAGRVNRDLAPEVKEAGNPPSGGDKLKQGRKEKAQGEVSKFPVHDKFVTEFDELRTNDANKLQLKAAVKRALKAGVLTDKDMKELDIAFKDRDMSADDIAPLVNSLIEANKEADKKAPEGEKAVAPAKVKEEVAAAPKKDERKRLPTLSLAPEEKPSPKAQGVAAAPETKAEPSTAVAIYNPAPLVDPAREAMLKKEQAINEETVALKIRSVKVEVDSAIRQIDSAKLDEMELRAAVQYLTSVAKDSGIDAKVRERASKYLKDTFTEDERTLYNRVQPEPVTEGSSDFDFIKVTMEQINSGKLRLTQSIIGQLTAAWKRLKPSDPFYDRSRNIKLSSFIKGGPQFFNMKDGEIVGRFSTIWQTPDVPMNLGKLKLIVGKFISKYASKPKVYVFKDQADLKASNPELYKRAAAGRPGDFDTAMAAGYSIGDTVIIFSDRIGSEQHLAFVLAHETLGHFGLRGLMGAGPFNKVMSGLYDTDPRLKAAVDAAMAVRGISKSEAVEEYLSDYAAQLHTSLVRRVWNGIKGVLNRVGIQFGDEATRYLLSQAKRYAKTGEKTAVFDTATVLDRIWGTENGEVGRFNTVELANENERIADLIRRTPIIPTDLKEAGRIIKNSGWSWDVFKQQVFSLANFQALRNPGLYKFEQLLDETRQREQYIYNRYNTKLEALLYKNEKHRDRVSRMLLGGRGVSVYRLLNTPLGSDDAKKKLFAIKQDEPGKGDLILNVSAADEYIQRGILSFDEMKNGVTVKREYMGADGKTVVEDYSFPGFSDLTKDQYNDYVLARRVMAEVELELLSAKYANFIHSERVSIGAIKRMLKKANAEDAEKMSKRTLNKYKEIYVSGYTVDERGVMQPGVKEIEQADKFLEAVNRALIDAKPTEKSTKDEARKFNDEAVRQFFEDQKQADDFMATLDDFRSKMADTEREPFQFQNEMKRIVLDDVSLDVEEERAKRTMAGGYVPVIRDKAFEMRLQAVDKNGNPVRIHEDIKELLAYSQFDNIGEAQRASELFAAELGDKEFEVYAAKDDGTYDTVTVKFKPSYGPALTNVATDPALNLDEFLHGLRLFKINLRPDQMTKVIRELTSSGDQLRKRLRFSNTPGYDKNSGVFAMTRHIQLRGATVAKTITRPRMRELLDRSSSESEGLWNGDLSGVFSTHTRWSAETEPRLKQHYRHQLDHKLHMFTQTYPGMKGWDGTKAGYEKLRAAGGMAQNNSNRFYDQAQRTMEFLEANRFVSESNFGSGRMASTLRAFTSIFQLGGSLAQGVMNMASPYTNWLPYMASYNAQSGFGGGFSVGRTIAAYQVALNQVGIWGLRGGKYNTAEFYESLARDPAAAAEIGLTADEAEALSAEIREGKLIPAQSNALLGTARTGTTNRWVLRGIDAFMAPFNLTEQASRRSAFLAAYRLAKERNMADDPKLSTKERERRQDEARIFAVQSLDLTMGEYSVLNRPPAWRDGLQSFLYMYKVYPTTTIQLLRRMDWKGRTLMLGTLWLMSGVAGFPFAEDIEDLLDTICQALGLQIGSVRAEFTKLLEEVSPGLSPFVLKGAINTALGIPADVASRFSTGDFVPGTGLLLAGSTIGEEVKDILGPMPAMLLGSAVTAKDLVSFPFSEKQTFQDALRASPVTVGRIVGDVWAYTSTGAIVDKRGYVVAPDASVGQIAARIMGFYPKAAAEQYEAIRIAKRVNNYQKEIVAGYRTAWVKAMLTGNPAYARQIERSVDEWNSAAKGTALEIANFRKNSQRALKEAKMSASQRTLRSTSKAGREEAAQVMDWMIN